MPSGYTAPIHSNPDFTFRDFASVCARGMGALIMLRDEPFDTPLPERLEADTSYYDTQERAAVALLGTLDTMNEAERIAYGQTQIDKTIDEATQRLAEEAKIRARADVIQAEARAWTPPTPDHEGLKRLMLEQLHADFGGGDALGLGLGEYHHRRIAEAQAADPLAVWDAQRVAETQRIERARTGREEEIERTAKRDAWLQALRAALPTAPHHVPGPNAEPDGPA